MENINNEETIGNKIEDGEKTLIPIVLLENIFSVVATHKIVKNINNPNNKILEE